MYIICVSSDETVKKTKTEGKAISLFGEVQFRGDQFARLVRKGRETFLGLIKQTIEKSTFIIENPANLNIHFIKAFKGDKNQIQFMSGARTSTGELVIVSNMPVDIWNIKNKIKGGELIVPEVNTGRSTTLGGTSPMLKQSTVFSGTILDKDSFAQILDKTIPLQIRGSSRVGLVIVRTRAKPSTTLPTGLVLQQPPIPGEGMTSTCWRLSISTARKRSRQSLTSPLKT